MLNRKSSRSSNPINAIAGLLVTVFVLIGLFYLAKFVFTILWWVSPIMFIASLIIDHTVFINFLKWIRKVFQRSPLLGIGIPVLSIIAFPLFALYLLLRAVLRKKAREIEEKVIRHREGEAADYEELDSHTLDLPPRRTDTPRPQPRIRKEGEEYDDFFEV